MQFNLLDYAFLKYDAGEDVSQFKDSNAKVRRFNLTVNFVENNEESVSETYCGHT